MRHILLLAIATSLTGCDGLGVEKFDREQARALIESTNIPSDQGMKLIEFAQCLNRKRMLTKDYRAGGYVLNGGSRDMIDRITTATGVIGGYTTTYLQNAYFGHVNVTGIVSEDPEDPLSPKEVQFTGRLSWRAYTNPAVESCVSPASERENRTAIARYFDDGWRIEFPSR